MMAQVSDLTVLKLNQSVKRTLQSAFPEPVWIRGIITGLRRVSGRGHTYFQLADISEPGEQSPAVADCALFAGDRSRIAIEAGRQAKLFELENDVEVRILVSVSFWDRSGRFQLIMKGFDADFAGDSSAVLLQRLIQQLEKEGVLRENGTFPFPEVPLNIGLVTSRGSAAEKDFVKTLDESGYPFRVYAAWATMQGSETSDSVCGAFNRLLVNIGGNKLDAVVLTRGGGSATDLAWFNNETIARTIAQLPWPVISAIGHEIDTTLPDHAAHTRAKTPTHAASILVDAVARFDDKVSILNRSLVSSVSPRIQMENLKIGNLAGNLTLYLASLPKRKSEVLHKLASKLNMSVMAELHRQESLISEAEKQVEIRDPKKMLKLGWAVVRNTDGFPLRTISAVNEGQTIKISMDKGWLAAVVKEKVND
ncbi:MAG: exodeoxyribonuclease VII large subunit [Candidatus Sabulitectum sp.]|nr:exodeoxyribonuclease VII large subunit [Candidatus Sabulitectum sp.]